jgi:hypothetical protein
MFTLLRPTESSRTSLVSATTPFRSCMPQPIASLYSFRHKVTVPTV